MAYKYKLGKVEIIKEDGVDNRLSVFVHCADDATGMEAKDEYIIDKADVPGWDKKLTEDKVKSFMKGYLSETRLDQLAAQIPTPSEAAPVETVEAVEISDDQI